MEENAALDLFFSYGHKDNELIVNMIRSRLLSRHHEVRIDTSMIRVANDWRERIADGISNANPILAFLSQHAMRTENNIPGVCLDELSIALSFPEKTIITILLEPEKRVCIPPIISSIQWLDMSDWREKYTAGPEVFDPYFEEKMALIVEAVESTENYTFHGEISALRYSLKPDLGKRENKKLMRKTLIGREWLSEIFHTYLEDRRTKRFLCIYGGPGSGKSHFLANAMYYQPQIAAGYFFEWNRQNANSVKECICTIAFEMATKLPDYRRELIAKLKADGRYFSALDDTNALEGGRSGKNRDWIYAQSNADLFAYLISDIIPIDGGRGNIIILIDAVDEASFQDGNPLVELLADDVVSRLPPWIKILLTAREEESIRLVFQSLEAREVHLDRVESAADVEAYLRFRLRAAIESGRLEEAVLKPVAERCERTFLFAEKLCDAYEDDPAFLKDLHAIPKTIDGLYYRYFRRLFRDVGFETVYDPLSIMIANNGEISYDVLCRIMKWNGAKISRFLQKMKSFVRVTDEENGKKLVFFHKTINEWLLNEAESGEYAVDPEDGKEKIRRFCMECMRKTDASPFSWGFDGGVSLFPFAVLKFVYQKLGAYGTRTEKNTLFSDLRFLYELQVNGYRNSEFRFSEEVCQVIKEGYAFLPPEKRAAQKRYYAGAQILYTEMSMAKDKKGVVEAFERLEEEFADILTEEPALYCCVERNICFSMRKVDLKAAKARLTALVKKAAELDYPEKQTDTVQFNYHLCVIHYDLGELEEAIECGELTLKLADRYFEEPRSARVLALNQLGSCYYRMSQRQKDDPEAYLESLKKQYRYKKQSLDERLSLYGKYNRYTANGYDYMARAELDLRRACGEPLPEIAYEYAELAIRIVSYVLGKDTVAYSRALQTRALLLEYEGKPFQALNDARQAYDILLKFGEYERKAIDAARRIYERIRQKCN